jgi:hypothetical protein
MLKQEISEHIDNLRDALRQNFPGKLASFTSKGVIAIRSGRQEVEDKTLVITKNTEPYQIIKIGRILKK